MPKQAHEIVFYIVRHGRTLFNMTDQVQGFSDSPLTSEGIKQAELVGKALSKIKFDLAVASDLSRQRNSAKIILSKNLLSKNIGVTENLDAREWTFGGFEGRGNLFFIQSILRSYNITYCDASDARKKFQELLKKVGERGFGKAIYKCDPLRFAQPYEAHVRRAKRLIQTLLKAGESFCKQNNTNASNILIVSSGCFIRTILHAHTPNYNGENILNCSVSQLVYKNSKFVLQKTNDIAHLKALNGAKK